MAPRPRRTPHPQQDPIPQVFPSVWLLTALPAHRNAQKLGVPGPQPAPTELSLLETRYFDKLPLLSRPGCGRVVALVGSEDRRAPHDVFYFQSELETALFQRARMLVTVNKRFHYNLTRCLEKIIPTKRGVI